MGHILFTARKSLITPVKYGLLYNWYAATDERKITSSDNWDIPNLITWGVLTDYIGGYPYSKLMENNSTYWDDGLTKTNLFNFSMRGGGYRSKSSIFNGLNQYGYLWIYDSLSTDSWQAEFIYNEETETGAMYQTAETQIGMYLRFVRPATEAEQLLADGTACAPYIGNDGKIYPTVKIGTQVWTAANSAETQYRNGDWIPGFDGGVYTPISNEAWAALTTAGVCAYEDYLANV